MPALVYQATNQVNGKRYIGVTGRSLELRQASHISAALSGRSGCPRFHAAIRKYGPDNFIFTVLENFESFEAASWAERWWISTDSPEYNVSPGGERIPGFRVSPHVLVKRSARVSPLKGRPRPPEVIEKMRVAFTGKKLNLSEEERQRRRVQILAVVARRPKATPKIRPAPRAAGVKIRALPCGTVFPSGKAASLYFGIPTSAVSNIANGKADTHVKGVTFEFCDELKRLKADRLRERRHLHSEIVRRMTPRVYKQRLGKRVAGVGAKIYATKLARGTVARPWLGKTRSAETKAKISATKRAAKLA